MMFLKTLFVYIIPRCPEYSLNFPDSISIFLCIFPQLMGAYNILHQATLYEAIWCSGKAVRFIDDITVLQLS
jgi:hypothetical protein